MKKIIIIFVLIVAGALFFLFYPVEKSESQNVKFTDEELGLSFEYPKEFGAVEVKIAKGERPGGEIGEKLVGSFAENPKLEFGGITDDFSAGREGMLTDTRGFLKEDGKYYFKFVSLKSPKDYELQPLKVIQKDFGEILLLNDQSFEAERNNVEGPVLGVGTGRFAGLVNLKNNKFPGLVFYNWDAVKFPLEDFEALLDSIEVSEPDLISYSNPNNDYQIRYPFGWYPYEIAQGVIFTKDKELDIPLGTEGYAIGSQFVISMREFTEIEGAETHEDWLEANGMGENSEFLIDRKTVSMNGIEMIRAVTEAAGAGGDVLTYVYFTNTINIITLSHYPYDSASQDSKDFEVLVKNFIPAMRK